MEKVLRSAVCVRDFFFPPSRAVLGGTYGKLG